jgi:hypothetical protein
VLVTDDNKEDWWHIVRSGGNKTIGPRRELLEEMRAAGVEHFHLYNSEQFLRRASEFFKIEVPTESIKQVEQVKRQARRGAITYKEYLKRHRSRMHEALLEWIAQRHSGDSTVIEQTGDWPTFVAHEQDTSSSFGYDFIFNDLSDSFRRPLSECLVRAATALSQGQFSQIVVVILSTTQKRDEAVADYLRTELDRLPSPGLSIISGTVAPQKDGPGRIAVSVSRPSGTRWE